jgi:hypothetical protein
MGAWQFIIVLVPEIGLWKLISIHRACMNRMDTKLRLHGRTANRRQTLKIYCPRFFLRQKLGAIHYCVGEMKRKNDIQVGYENNSVKDIQIRLALHTQFMPLIGKLIEVVNELNCVLFFLNYV